jgi:hypothetical protein
LIIADDNARAGADPAFDARMMPVGDWATAVWEGWMPERAMERLTAAAKKKLRNAKNVRGQGQRPSISNGGFMSKAGLDGGRKHGASYGSR